MVWDTFDFMLFDIADQNERKSCAHAPNDCMALR